MPLPRSIGRLNRVGLNRLSTPAAAHVPGFGVVVHRGRRSGREYRTPVNVFAADGGYLIALTYGPGADWVRNVVAAGGCELVTRGEHHHLTGPRVVHDEQRTGIRPVERQVLRLLGVADFLVLSG